MTQEPTAIYQDGTYLAHNQSWHAEDSPWKARQIEKLFARNDLNPLTVCEVGCGAGEILRQLSQNTRETQYFGYELSPQALELCRSRETDRIKFFGRSILEEDVRFDCLLCVDVFEHVEDYFGFIRGLREKAEYKVFHIPLDINALSIVRGGLMAARKTIGHIQYFSPETAIATLEDCGYEIIDGFYTMKEPITLKGLLAKLPRKLLFAISPLWLSRLLGGCEYMVLTR